MGGIYLTKVFDLPRMISPVSNSTLAGTGQTFTWDPGSAREFHLNVGTRPTTWDVYESGWTKATSVLVPNIPAKGVKLYVRLSYRVNGTWNYTDYEYTEPGVFRLPSMTSPVPSSILVGRSQIFTWDPGSLADFQFNIGSQPGWSDIYHTGWTKATSAQVPIPAQGLKIYARLLYELNGTWNYIDYVYTEPSAQ